MCGIAGFLTTNLSNTDCENTLKLMANTLARRGPDDEGIWFDIESGIGLAHRRLSIIDLSKEGRQPMSSPSGRYVVTYNGEIYNYRRIRKSLENVNIHWRGNSDTEIMLAAIETWGLKEAVKNFNGMFAFAIWDKKHRILHLCRDRLGIKPLYYALLPHGIVFGSELRPIKVYSGFKPVINRDALTLYLRYNYIPEPYAIYCDTFKLLQGHILSVSMDNIAQGKALPDPVAYWSAKEITQSIQNNPVNSINDAAEELDVLLHDSIGMQMESDVPIGMFLSGGIDSSMVAALMQAQSTRKIKTFSIGFYEHDFDESLYAKAVASHLGTEHTELYISPDDTKKVIPNLPTLYDEPFSDPSQIPTLILSMLSKDSVSVCLSGDGGDELFGGYDRYFIVQKIWKTLSHVPLKIRRNIADKFLKFPPSTWNVFIRSKMTFLPQRCHLSVPGNKFYKLAEILDVSSFEETYLRLISHWQRPKDIVLGGNEPISVINGLDKVPNLDEFIHRMMWLDMMTYLPGDILTKVDRASMGVGLEVRVPLLDHRVVEFAWRLPLEMKIYKNKGKHILRRILYRYIPRNLIERPKRGFGIPLKYWLRGPLREWAEALLDEQRLKTEGFFSPTPIQNKWKEHLSGIRNWQSLLWDILMFQSWLAEENG